MARDFVAASSQYLQASSAVVSAPPFTVSCWFKSDNVTAIHALVNIDNSSSDADSFTLRLRGDVAGDPVEANAISSAGGGPARSTSGYSAGTWHHAVGVFASSTSRTAYLDGGNAGSDTADRSPASVNLTSVGMERDNSPGRPHDGQIAEVAIWDVALTAGEINALSNGASPLKIRPHSLVAYWPLYGLDDPERNLISSSFPLANTGTTQADHSPLTQPPFANPAGWKGGFTSNAQIITKSPTRGVLSFIGGVPGVDTSIPVTKSPSTGILEFLGGVPGSNSVLEFTKTPTTGVLSFIGGTPDVFSGQDKTKSPSTGILEFLGGVPGTSSVIEVTKSPSLGVLSFLGGVPGTSSVIEKTKSPSLGILSFLGEVPGVGTVGPVTKSPSTGILSFIGGTPQVIGGGLVTKSPATGVLSFIGGSMDARAQFWSALPTGSSLWSLGGQSTASWSLIRGNI